MPGMARRRERLPMRPGRSVCGVKPACSYGGERLDENVDEAPERSSVSAARKVAHGHAVGMVAMAALAQYALGSSARRHIGSGGRK